MSITEKTKYIEAGSGQVFYFWFDESANAWALDMAIMGPEPLQRCRTWSTRDDAERALIEMGLRPFDPR